MASWQEFIAAAPELAAAVQRGFEGHLHHVLATVRSDGSPRVSGTEVRIWRDDLWLGAMPGSRKVADLRRDGRFAVHAAPIDTKLVDGDIKISGLAVEQRDPALIAAYLEHDGEPGDPSDAAIFFLDLRSATRTQVAENTLAITHWDSEQGLTGYSVA
jgi:hypothetical protein